MRRRPTRIGFSLIEFLVVAAVMAVLVALLIPAVQRVRESANKSSCQNRLKQLALAIHQFHDEHGVFPPGLGALNDSRNVTRASYLAPTIPPESRVRSWPAHVLPFMGENSLYMQLPLNPPDPPMNNKYDIPVNALGATPLSQFQCPSDPRAGMIFDGAATSNLNGPYSAAGVISFAGVGGVDSWSNEWPNSTGVLFWRSKVRFSDVVDGSQSTLLIGERPPDPQLQFGWWQSVDTMGWRRGDAEWEYDTVQYMSNSGQSPWPKEKGANTGRPCVFPLTYGPGRTDNSCDFGHFWGHHVGGALFAFVDGSVRFLPYRSRPIMNALATRNGGEIIRQD